MREIPFFFFIYFFLLIILSQLKVENICQLSVILLPMCRLYGFTIEMSTNRTMKRTPSLNVCEVAIRVAIQHLCDAIHCQSIDEAIVMALEKNHT